MKKSDLKAIIRECIEEIMVDEQDVDEAFGLTFDKNKKKIRKQTDAEKFRKEIDKEKKVAQKAKAHDDQQKKIAYAKRLGRKEAGWNPNSDPRRGPEFDGSHLIKRDKK